MIEESTGPPHGEERGDVAMTRGRFGRLFDLPPFNPPAVQLDVLAHQMTLDPDTPDSCIPAGYTVLGQFITHDLALDRTALGETPIDPSTIENYRRPRLDLDSVYEQSPHLLDPPPHETGDPANPKMMIGVAAGPGYRIDDVPRYQADQSQHITKFTAIIGDVRNDENLLVSQVHLAFLKLHNRFVDDIEQGRIVATEIPGQTTFDKARRLCEWHYQWIVVNDYLPRIVGRDTVNAVLTMHGNDPPTYNLRLYDPAASDPVNLPMMPVEFSAAAFRFGHSMIRPVYRVAADGGAVNLFGDGYANLGGRQPLTPVLKADWHRFFFRPEPCPGQPGAEARFVNHAKKIDSHLPQLLANLPAGAQPHPIGFNTASLARRDLQRGVMLGLPSGQRFAQAVHDRLGTGDVPLSNEQLGLTGVGWGGEAPLWPYFLKEAELPVAQQGGGGERLGLVGGRVVAEVIIGLLKHDNASYLNRKPGFRPAIAGDPITMLDILRLAGVAS